MVFKSKLCVRVSSLHAVTDAHGVLKKVPTIDNKHFDCQIQLF